MYFALFSLLFFALDILLIFKFQALGLIPMEYLVAGVGLFCTVIFIKQYKFFKILNLHKILTSLFISYVFFVAVGNLILPTFTHFFKNVEHRFIYDYVKDLALLGYSVILCICIAAFFGIRGNLTKWIFFSAIGGILRFSILRIDHLFEPPISILIWRYLGILDMIMLFGWLMIIHTLIHAEDDAERSIDAIPSLR